MSVFRLEERIHQFFGGDIWHLPLKTALAADKEKLLRDWIGDLLDGSSEYLTQLGLATVPGPIDQFLTHHSSHKSFANKLKYGMPYYIYDEIIFGTPENPLRSLLGADLSEIFSAHLVLSALRVAGVETATETSSHLSLPSPFSSPSLTSSLRVSFLAPIQVLARNIHGVPELIREEIKVYSSLRIWLFFALIGSSRCQSRRWKRKR